MKNIIKTLLWRDLLPLALAVYLGTVFQNFFKSLVSHIILPLIANITPFYLGTISEHKIDYKELTIDTITLIIAIIIIYIFVKFIIIYSK
tara:strand:- start:11020 stop:11289 length:270 start_codon:yes stop_codon:yes gene_type:complete